MKAIDRALLPPPGKRHLVVLAQPCDFERDVLPTLPRDVWERLEPEERVFLAKAMRPYGYLVRLAMRGLLRGFAPRNVAAAAGVTPRAVRQWLERHPRLRDDWELVEGLAGCILERKLAEEALGDGPQAQRAREFWLKAAAPETYGNKLGVELSEAERGRQREREILDGIERPPPLTAGELAELQRKYRQRPDVR